MAGGEGASAHPTVVAVGEFAAQGIKKFKQGHDTLLSIYTQSQSGGLQGRGAEDTKHC